MSSEWILTTLGEICSKQRGAIQTGPFGSQLHTSDYKEVGIPVVMPTNIGDGGIATDGIARIDQSDVERLQQHKLQLDDIVFSRRGDVTKNALICSAEVGWLCGTGCLKVRLGEQTMANATFISYYLRLPETKEWLVRHAVGATMPNLNTGILSSVPIRLPPLKNQFEIAAILGTLDGRITLLRETNKTLESIAQAIFKSWFVDFDPVRVKMDGRQPEGMDEETAALFPDSFEESGLGLIPTQWSARSFHEMIRIIGGGTPKTSNPDYWGGHIPWYSVVDVPKGADTFVVNTEKKVTQAGLEGSSTKMLPFGTTIISARGTVGKLALTGCEMAMNQSCYGLRGQNNDIFFTYFSTQRLVEHLKQQAHGSVFDTITTATFKGVRVVSPPPSIIAKFETNVEVLMERVLVNLKTLTSLAQLRDTLLPRLISGQLCIPEAQEQIENALQ